jgi:hypothetical protein
MNEIELRSAPAETKKTASYLPSVCADGAEPARSFSPSSRVFGNAERGLVVGSWKKNAEPLPSSDSSQMRPPIRSTSSLQM